MIILLFIAFISGLLTILAPCIWPILPIVLSASSTGGRSKPLGITLGILISFTVFTLTLSYLVSIFHFDPNTLRSVAVVVLTLLGLSLVIPRFSALIEIGVGRLSNLFGPGSGTTRTGFFGGLVTGVSLGIVWAPCAGPILASIAALAATQMVTTRVVLVTAAYMVGTGIPLFIFATVGSNLLTRTRSLSPYLGRIQQFFGIVIIVTALAIFTNYDKVIQAKLLDSFPGYSNFLFKLEQNKRVREELDVLRGRPSRTESRSFLSDLGEAPDFMGVNRWLNSEPLTMSKLRGKVVLVDFWTYTCINCIRTLPYVTGWYEKYKDKGLVVVGVHTPEFEFEKKTENVEKAISMYKINYPVAQDNDYATWNNFDNLYWPAKYLIDKNGRIRLTHFGEGEYEQMERAIQSLLAETGAEVTAEVLDLPDLTPITRMTPEIYLGLARMDGLVSKESPKTGTNVFSLSANLPRDSFSFGGTWTLTREYAQSEAGSVLDLKFYAKQVFLVITPGEKGDKIGVFLDGKKISDLILDEARLYELISLPAQGEHLLHLEFRDPGIQIFAFTFG